MKRLTVGFRRSRKLERIKKAVGTTLNLQCLEISEGDGTISAQLRTLGGSWKTAVVSKDAADSTSYSLSEAITTLDSEKLPFEDHTFDRLVIVDALKWFAEDFGSSNAAQLRTIAPYLPDAASRNAASAGEGRIAYLDYDWSLNDQKHDS